MNLNKARGEKNARQTIEIAVPTLNPADARSSADTGGRRYRQQNHSRLRREHSSSHAAAVQHWDSSPLARGARVGRAVRLPRLRIIPACAGSTPPPRPPRPPCGDHPRLSGEHIWRRRYYGVGEGSSPLARGALAIDPMRDYEFGIIPACAGSTATGGRWGARSWDHPRLRGEHNSLLSWGKRVRGSSPLARGALGVLLELGLAHGIIPACAGSTYGVGEFEMQVRDHPRLRGEHSSYRSMMP